MLSSAGITLVVLFYVGLLFLLSFLYEKRIVKKNALFSTAIIYSLSLAVYCTAWTFYGSVGMGASRGLLYLTIYLGPTCCAIVWWSVVRKLIRIKNRFKITSIVDFVAARYGKSTLLGAIGSFLVFLGTIPYIALQLKAIIRTYSIVATGDATSAVGSNSHLGWGTVVLISLCTIFFGLRKSDSSERHPGIVVFLAIECFIKLVAFIAVGIFACYFLFDGYQDIISKMPSVVGSSYSFMGKKDGVSAITYISYFILGGAAIIFLPRQFHVAVVENQNEDDVQVASWVFPLYLFLLNLFVIPISMAGLLIGESIDLADSFVLLLPYNNGQTLLTILTFLGGFSAATGMIMISSLAVSIILSNHVVLPIVDRVKGLAVLKKHLLVVRWIIVFFVIVTAYLYTISLSNNYALISMGMISFVASLQFAPSIIGGLYWRRGNKQGAKVGLSLGIIVWLYTLFIPAFVTGGLLDSSFMYLGPWGIKFLRPYSLFGLVGLDKVSHSVFWTMLFNLGSYVVVSLLSRTSTFDEKIANDFVNITKDNDLIRRRENEKADILLSNKTKVIENIFNEYYDKQESQNNIDKILGKLDLVGKIHISIGELLQLREFAEVQLSGTVGSAVAHSQMIKSSLFTHDEDQELSRYFEDTLAELKISPMQLLSKLDLYKEREAFMEIQTKDLENLVELRTEALLEKNSELNTTLEKIKSMQEKLVAQEKLASLGALSAGIAHEIKNPLNFIINGAKMISTVEGEMKRIYEQKGEKDNEELLSNLEYLNTATKMIIEHGNKADNIIKTMLQHSRSDTFDFSVVEISKLVEENYHLAYNGMKTKYKIDIDLDISCENVGKVRANEQSLGRALFNIIDNGLYALYQKSKKDESFTPQIIIKTYLDNDDVVILIRDNGLGIPKDKIKDIFNPFVTSKPTGEGTGLGLSITNDIIAHHNGSLDVDSVEGDFTQFIIRMPLDFSEKDKKSEKGEK